MALSPPGSPGSESSPVAQDVPLKLEAPRIESIASRLAAAPVEMRHIFRLGWSQSVMLFIQNSQTAALLIAVSTFGNDDDVAGVSTGMSMSAVPAIAINCGLVAAIDTLVSQEYGRDPRSLRMGHYLKAVLLELVASSILLSANAIYVMPRALPLLISNDTLIHNTTKFLSACPFFVLFFSTTRAIGKFAINQQRPKIASFAAVVTAIFAIPFYFVVLRIAPKAYLVEFAALALGTTYLSQTVLILFLILRVEQTRHTLGGWEINLSWHDVVKPTLRYGLPSIPLVGGEMAAFNIAVIITAMLPSDQNVAFDIMSNVMVLAFCISFGVTGGSSSLLGEALGAGDAVRARRIIVAGVASMIIMVSVISIVFAFLHRVIFAAYTSSPAVLDWSTTLVPIFVVFHALDCLQYVGMMYACVLGKNEMGALICLAGFYGISIPLGFVVVKHRGADVVGFCMAWCSGLLFLNAAYALALRFTTHIASIALHSHLQAKIDRPSSPACEEP
jgi:MATE family multidrug resistance protein